MTLDDDDWLRVRDTSPLCGVDGWDDNALFSAILPTNLMNGFDFFFQLLNFNNWLDSLGYGIMGGHSQEI